MFIHNMLFSSSSMRRIRQFGLESIPYGLPQPEITGPGSDQWAVLMKAALIVFDGLLFRHG